MTTTKKLDKLTINRTEWLRGEGSMYSYLRRASDQKKCCIGILLCALDVKEETLLSKHAVQDLFIKLPAEQNWLNDRSKMESFYRQNDNTTITEEEREVRLTDLFAEQGIVVTFVD
jgi:hypothetical protein